MLKIEARHLLRKIGQSASSAAEAISEPTEQKETIGCLEMSQYKTYASDLWSNKTVRLEESERKACLSAYLFRRVTGSHFNWSFLASSLSLRQGRVITVHNYRLWPSVRSRSENRNFHVAIVMRYGCSAVYIRYESVLCPKDLECTSSLFTGTEQHQTMIVLRCARISFQSEDWVRAG